MISTSNFIRVIRGEPLHLLTGLRIVDGVDAPAAAVGKVEMTADVFFVAPGSAVYSMRLGPERADEGQASMPAMLVPTLTAPVASGVSLPVR